MKTSSEDIFHLIHSLTRSEKRYFKLVSGLQEGDKLYIKLFDEICHQKQYDEEKLVSTLKLNKKKKWFSFLKMRLYDLITKSLENYHYNNYAASQIRSSLNKYDILLKKALYHQCQVIIKKIKKIAGKYEFHSQLTEILDKEYQLNMLLSKKSNVLKESIRHSENIFESEKQTRKYFYLFENLHIAYYTFGATRNPKEYHLMKSVFNNPLIRSQKEPETFFAKDNYFLIHTFKNYFEHNFKKMNYYAKRRADLFINNPHMIFQNPITYIRALSNLLISSFHLNNHRSSEYYLKKLDEIYSTLSAPHDKKQAFVSSLFGLKYYFHIKNYEKANAKAQLIIDELPAYEDTLGLINKTDFYANIFLNFFYITDYHKAIHWLNKIRNFEAPRSDKEYFYNVLPMLYLITHYQAGADKDLLSSLFQSTFKKLKKKSLIFKLETILKDFFSEYLLPDSISNEKIYNGFLKLKKTLDRLSNDPLEKRAFLYFDFIFWANLNIKKYSGRK